MNMLSKIAAQLAEQWRLDEKSDFEDSKVDSHLQEVKIERATNWVSEAQAIVDDSLEFYEGSKEPPEIREVVEEPPEIQEVVEEPPEIQEAIDDPPDTLTAGIGTLPDQDHEDSLESLDPGYLELVLASPAYQWFVAALRREVVLNLEDSPSMIAIRKAIRDGIAFYLPSSSRISTRRSVKVVNLTFHISWDPIKFVEDQQYQEKPEDAIYRAVTLTGTVRNAQALTSAQYLLQTWPTTGQKILELIQGIVAGGSHEKVSC